MDPNTKLILDEMEKRFTTMDLKWQKKFDELTHNKEERLDVLEQANDELVSRKPSVDAAMDSIKLELKRLTKEWDRSMLESVVVNPGLLAKPESVSARPSAGIHTDGPLGHRDDLHYRDQGLGPLRPSSLARSRVRSIPPRLFLLSSMVLCLSPLWLLAILWIKAPVIWVNCPKFLFPRLTATILDCGFLAVKFILICFMLSLTLGSEWCTCICHLS
jgi:hypothetical protein